MDGFTIPNMVQASFMEGPQEGFPTVERPSLDTHETNPPLPPSFSYQTEPTVCHMFGIGFGHIVLGNMLSCKKSRAYKYEWMILLLSTAFPNMAEKHEQHLPLSIKISVEQEAKHCPTRHSPLVSPSLPKEPHDPGRTMTYAYA